MNPIEQYIHNRDEQIKENMEDEFLKIGVEKFSNYLVESNYTKNFTWMGVPILQYPSDLMVMQELIWKIKPDVIIETGIAFGGMTVFYGSILHAVGDGILISIDIDIRKGNEKKIKNILSNYNYVFEHLIEADSANLATLKTVKEIISPQYKVLVSLDSNHTHTHVLQELNLYAPLVSVGSYIVVFDTAIEFFGHLDKNQDRPWGKGNNPWTAVQEFMKTDMGKNFVVDKEVEQRALVTAAPGGWLRRVK